MGQHEIIAGSVDAAPPTSSQDPFLYRMIVGAFGLMGLLCVIGALVLSYAGKPVPEVVQFLGGGVVGALGALLAPSPAQRA